MVEGWVTYLVLRQSLLLQHLLHAEYYVLLGHLPLVQIRNAPNLRENLLELLLSHWDPLDLIEALYFNQLVVKLRNVGSHGSEEPWSKAILELRHFLWGMPLKVLSQAH